VLLVDSIDISEELCVFMSRAVYIPPSEAMIKTCYSCSFFLTFIPFSNPGKTEVRSDRWSNILQEIPCVKKLLGNLVIIVRLTLYFMDSAVLYSRTPVSADSVSAVSVSAVSVIRGLPWPENINTFTTKVDHGRFKSLRFNLPASTLVDLKFTLRFYI
jgi:hypothetical protein